MNRDEIIEAGARALADAWDPAAFRLVLPAEFAEAAYDAMVPLIRAEIAEEIAVAQELAAGERCPQCRGKVASRKWVRGHILSRCGCGNSWDDKSGRFVEYPKIAREIGEQR